MNPPDVLSTEHRALLEAIAAELEQTAVTPNRRTELLDTLAEIAAEYSCDARLAE